jgi:hypothetical protein
MTQETAAAVRDDEHQPGSRPEMAFVVEQMKQAMESYRAAMLAVISFSTVLVVVNATLLGYAVNQRLAGLLLVGPLFPVTMVAAVLIIRRMQTPMLYVMVALEHRFGGDDFDWDMTTFAAAVTSPEYVERVRQIAHIADRRERMLAIEANPPPIIGTGHGVLRGLLVIVAVGQIVAAFVTWHFYGWRVF